MIKAKKSKLIVALMTIVMTLAVLFGVMTWRDNKSVQANAEESVSITQVQFRTNVNGYFFLRMSGQTDYTVLNQWHDGSELTGNVLDKVTVYFLHGAYSLREIWNGVNFGTYIWGDDHTLAFPMKDGFVANQGVGAKIEAGTEIYMLSGANKVTTESRSFWSNGTGPDNAINNYAVGSETIPATLKEMHLRLDDQRMHIMVALGEGNDWDGKGEGICTQAKAPDGTSTYADANWMKLYLTNFTSKIKLHVKETNTWVSYGSIISRDPAPQWAFVYNGWSSEGGIMRLRINSNYNGMTVDKVLFEEGCELPSYAFNAAAIAHTVHVLDKAYLFESLDMSAQQATNWSVSDAVKVTFNGANATYVKPGDAVSFPTALSETKPDDENGSYIYNWFLNGEKYDFKTPVTENINLTSDGTFTVIPPMDSVIYLNEDGSVYKTEKYPEGTDIILPSIPKKVGYKATWKTLDGENAPLVMPEGDVTLQAVYTKDFYLTQVQFRTSGTGEPYFFLRFNDTDYMTGNQVQDASFVKETNLLDNVTVYFDDGAYSLRDIWDGTTLFTYIWGDTHTLAFRLLDGFVPCEGRGAKIEQGAEIPMISGSVLTTDTTRTFWQIKDRSSDFGIAAYVDGYQEIETTVDCVYFDQRFIIDLGDGNDWAGHEQALPTQAQDANGATDWASAHWDIMYMTNFQTTIKLHLKESDTWMNLGDAMKLMEYPDSPQWMFIFNGWGDIDGTLRIEIDYNLFNGMTIDKVLFEEGCQLPSYNAAAGMGYIMHVLTSEVLFESNDTSAEVAVNWTKLYKVTFNGENTTYVAPGALIEYPTELSGSKPATAEYTYVYNWFVNGEVYDFSKPVNGSVDLVSDGSYTEIPNEYKVTYYALDGTTVLYEDIFAYGEELTVRTAASIEGYVDCSWNYNGEGDVPTTMPAMDLSFTVQGTAKTYTLTIAGETISVTYAQPIGQLPAVPEEEGFSGVWTIDGETLTADSIWRFDADKAAEAYYVANTYTLTIGDETITVTYSEVVGQLPAVPEKEHYVGSWAVNGNALNADTVWSYASDMTAEVVYTPVNYIVTFDGENEVEYAYGSKIEKPADPTKESTQECDYVFDAWYNGDVKWNFDTDVVEGDLDLVAKYTEAKKMYTVTFVVKGHTISLDPVEVAYGDTLDLTALFNENEVAGYTYLVTVNGVEKASIKVVADVTVEIEFTEKADLPADTTPDSSSASSDNFLASFGCAGVVGGLSMAIATLTMVGAVLVCKKKED